MSPLVVGWMGNAMVGLRARHAAAGFATAAEAQAAAVLPVREMEEVREREELADSTCSRRSEAMGSQGVEASLLLPDDE